VEARGRGGALDDGDRREALTPPGTTLTTPMPPSDPDDEALAAQGERFVEIAATFLLAVSIVGVAYYVYRSGTARLPQQIVRVLLTAGLAYALVRGRRWARWLTVAIVILTFALVVPAVARSAFREMPALESIGLLALVVGYGIVGRGLLWSRSVRAFFASRSPRDA
jgi:ABC-type glycerol-3-phosphate transport system permease component